MLALLLPDAYLLRPGSIVSHELLSSPLAFLRDWRTVLVQATPLTAVVLFELLLLALLGRPWLWLLLHLPFLLWLPGELFYLHHYGTPTSAHVFAIMGETNHDEISGYLGKRIWLELAGAVLWLAFLLGSLRFFYRHVAPWRHRTRLWTLLAIGLSLAVTLLAYKRASDEAVAGAAKLQSGCAGEFCGYTALSPFFHVFIDSYPFGVPVRLYDYHMQRRMLAHYAAILKNEDPGLRRTPGLDEQAEVYVVVIGESARADHWQLFGYARETTPLLSRRDNLLAFGDAVSVTPATRTSVPILLSGASIDDIAAFRFRPSWISAFKAADRMKSGIHGADPG
jgi:glucan phosphoethanolaminetransferase (alkaline phosphatase superfamily)